MKILGKRETRLAKLRNVREVRFGQIIAQPENCIGRTQRGRDGHFGESSRPLWNLSKTQSAQNIALNGENPQGHPDCGGAEPQGCDVQGKFYGGSQ